MKMVETEYLVSSQGAIENKGLPVLQIILWIG